MPHLKIPMIFLSNSFTKAFPIAYWKHNSKSYELKMQYIFYKNLHFLLRNSAPDDTDLIVHRANRKSNVHICCKFCCKWQVQVNPITEKGKLKNRLLLVLFYPGLPNC